MAQIKKDTSLRKAILQAAIISPKNGQKIPKITNLQYNKGRANYGTKKKSIYG